MGAEVYHAAYVGPNAAEEFAQALRDESNLEMDWLCLATRVESNRLRRCCLQRTLRINPHSALAKHRLAQLSRGGNRPLDLPWADR